MDPILVVIIAILVTIAILVIAGYICKAIGKKYKREALVIYDEIKKHRVRYSMTGRINYQKNSQISLKMW